MNKEIKKLSESNILKSFPIKGQVSGWYFRVTEISNGAWLVEGSDQFGRMVSANGSNPEELLQDLSSQASELNERIKNT